MLFALLLAAAAAPDVTAWRQAHESQILAELIEFLKIPNVAADPAGLDRNAGHIQRMLERRGVRSELWREPGTPAVVFGELPVPGARQTLLFYAHYDGQPVNPKDWKGQFPFEPLLRSGPLESGGKTLVVPAPGVFLNPEYRIYARSASDDKAPILAMMAALDALQAAGRRPSVNLKFVFEGEEEAGSANLGQILAAHRDRVQADAWLICDGPVHQTRTPQLYFGARGVTSLELTVYGPSRELHSGHYGNWAPNPALRLARLLASMKDDEGRVQIAGFYQGIAPLTDTEKKALASEPLLERDLRQSLLLGSTDNSPRRLSDTLTEPSLNIRGLASAAVGDGAANVIPTQATASIDIRLVKGNDWKAMLDKVREHVRAQGYLVTENEPTPEQRLNNARVARIRAGGGYNAVRTSMDLAISRQIIANLERLHPNLVKLPTLGGSVPLSIIEQVVSAPLIGVPIVNHDNNQHSANENLRLKNLWDGIDTMAALFELRQ